MIKINKWRLTDYCDDCPFKDRDALHVSEDRLNEIKRGVEAGGSFNCHKTVYPEVFNEEPVGLRMCYGAYKHLKRLGKPNQIMQIAERLGEDTDV